ncbi:MAG TPA: hypothetical protein VGG77_11310, partial [Roseiarcus sp.]
LDRLPEAMTIRRQTVEHPFGTLKAWMGSTHFLTKTLDKVRTEMSLQVGVTTRLAPRRTLSWTKREREISKATTRISCGEAKE